MFATTMPTPNAVLIPMASSVNPFACQINSGPKAANAMLNTQAPVATPSMVVLRAILRSNSVFALVDDAMLQLQWSTPKVNSTTRNVEIGKQKVKLALLFKQK